MLALTFVPFISYIFAVIGIYGINLQKFHGELLFFFR